MKVAIVINTSWNIYNYRLGLVKALIGEGHEVYAIAPRDEFSEPLMEVGCHYVPIEMDNWGTNPISDLKLIYDFHKVYKALKPDVVFHFTIKPNIYGAIAARILGIPSMCNVSGLGTVFMKETLVTKLVKKMYQFAFRYPKKVFFQNEDDIEFFKEHDLIAEDKIEIVPGSGVNTEHFVPNGLQKNGKFIFLMVSRLLYDKGVLEYIEATKQIQSNGRIVEFQILGGIDPGHVRGIPRESVKEWVDEGLINYLGTTTDVRPHIEQADCVVLPSYREGTPRTLLEAASMAKPLLATDVPGCNNVVEHNVNGYLCKVKDVDDLVTQMKRMIKASDEELIKFGENGRNMVKSRFDERIIINQYMNALNQISKDVV
jgi:glycosyltransferase involved in cell wall biosynthesis